jgi:hypothetical protein
VVAEKADITITQQSGSLMQMSAGAQLSDVVKALNALGATPQDLLAILQAMKSAGRSREIEGYGAPVGLAGDARSLPRWPAPRRPQAAAREAATVRSPVHAGVDEEHAPATMKAALDNEGTSSAPSCR